MMRTATVLISIAAAAGMLLGLVWLRDTRVSHDRAQLEIKIAEGRRVVLKLPGLPGT